MSSNLNWYLVRKKQGPDGYFNDRLKQALRTHFGEDSINRVIDSSNEYFMGLLEGLQIADVAGAKELKEKLHKYGEIKLIEEY